VDRKRWMKRRKEVWERDNRRCVRCARLLCLAEMDAHHKLERSRGGGDELGNLECRCRACHSDVHA
jgi:5-methylcytosine-specific restriction endonuclease McrA